MRLHQLPTMLLIGLCLFLSNISASAQDEPPAPQFLYRSENHLILLNGYTGEATTVPIVVGKGDRFEWSPDGRYLLTRLQSGWKQEYCLNLYDVDAQAWVYNRPISCAVSDAIFSDDGTRIYYSASTDDTNNAILSVYSLENQTSRELYRTTEGDDLHPASISELQWSPTKSYLTFGSYVWIMGGTLNFFVVLNVENQHYAALNAPNPYYASYSPTWSADDRWFLIELKEEYVTSGSLPVTNDEGDIYLVNSETGEGYRLTYTPAGIEGDVHWTEDGGIAYTEWIEQKTNLTLQQAMNVPVVPRDQIVEPEPVDRDNYYDPLQGVMISPDAMLGAWVTQTQQAYELDIGDILQNRSTNFSVPLPADYQSNILIGWRPSDYPYPYG